MKTKKADPGFGILLLICFSLLVLSSGCVTAPQRESLPIYNINGVNYVSLLNFSLQRDLSWEYDTFTKRATIASNAHKVTFWLGDTLVSVDGDAKELRHPVDLYRGMVVVPYAFKESVLDGLFREKTPAVAAKSVREKIAIKKIVIDPGHGGKDPGAIGAGGLKEKDVNLDIAKRLAKILKDNGVEVVLTRSSDVFISLAQRVNIANASGADLFVSVHANANRVRGLNGFEVYYISPSLSGDSRRAVASAKSIPPGVNRDYMINSADLRATLWDMVYTSNRAASIELASSVCRSMESSLDAKILGVKSANFYVLKGVNIPAVLLEIGFLSNSVEERKLKNSYYRQQVAEAITQGIKRYAREDMLVEADK